MGKYLFIFRGQEMDAEIKAATEQEARDKLTVLLLFDEKRPAVWKLRFICENFDCPKCRPVIPECNYDA